jgi:hypothetical protein
LTTGRKGLARPALMAAGAAVVLVLGAGWFMLRDADPRPDTRPGPLATWPPPRIDVMADPPPLPTDRGIGPGALLYLPVADGPATAAWRILTADGKHYRTPATPEPGSDFPPPASLSPDGRWLSVHRSRDLVLRDLTGTSERTVTTHGYQSSSAFWSPDSRQLVLVRSIPREADAEVRVIDVVSGAQSPPSTLAALREASLLGVDSSGNLVLRSDTPIPGSPSSFLTLRFVDPITGRERRHLVVDPRTLLGRSASTKPGDQGIVPGASLLAGDSLLVLTTDPVTSDRGLLVVDLDTGKLIELHALPSDQAGRGPVMAAPETILFIRTGPSRDRPDAITTALEELDRKTGESRVVTSITGEVRLLLVRGMALGML